VSEISIYAERCASSLCITASLLPLYLVSPLMKWNWSWQWVAWPLYLGNFLRFLYPHQNNHFVAVFADADLVSRARYGIELHLGHFWTLCIEEQFYLVWPWIVFKVRDRRRLIGICIACVLLVPVARSTAQYYLPQALLSGEVVLHSTPFRFDTLLWGALIALLYRGAHRDQMQWLARTILPIAALCALWCEASWYVFDSTRYDTVVQRHPWMLSVVAVFAGALLLRALVPGTVVYRIFNLRWLRLVGTVSYGAYIFHDIPHSIYERAAAAFFPNDLSSMTPLIGLTSTLALAFLSYRYFESPILQMKDRLTRRGGR
jgi:peptidoglycan/LPS O-acetylase OafA/YrhL